MKSVLSAGSLFSLGHGRDLELGCYLGTANMRGLTALGTVDQGAATADAQPIRDHLPFLVQLRIVSPDTAKCPLRARDWRRDWPCVTKHCPNSIREMGL